MTMQHSTHPDDEQLAAFAGADRDAVADRGLAEHIAACERCGPIVDELTILRGSLALLPDVAPSRPLRLIPPVAEPVRRSGALEWLRRLAAPAMAAGAMLVLVGAVGVSGIAGGLASRVGFESDRLSSNGARAPADHGGAPSLVPTSDTGEFTGRTEVPRSQTGGETATPATATPAPAPGTGKDLNGGDRGSTEQPWLTLLIAGFGTFGVAAILRFSLTPRAG